MSTTDSNPSAAAPGSARASTAPSAAGDPAAGARSDDWTTAAADTIERAVATVRERTVEPARSATKAVVFGLMAGLVALPAVVLLLVVLFRVLVIICQGEVWAAWLAMGGIFVGFGALVWARRNS